METSTWRFEAHTWRHPWPLTSYIHSEEFILDYVCKEHRNAGSFWYILEVFLIAVKIKKYQLVLEIEKEIYQL